MHRVVSPIRFLGRDRVLGPCRDKPRQFHLDRCQNVRLAPAADFLMPVATAGSYRLDAAGVGDLGSDDFPLITHTSHTHPPYLFRRHPNRLAAPFTDRPARGNHQAQRGKNRVPSSADVAHHDCYGSHNCG